MEKKLKTKTKQNKVLPMRDNGVKLSGPRQYLGKFINNSLYLF